MDDYTTEQRQLIAKAVTDERHKRQWGKEEAARHALISSITWKRVEDGLRVQTTKLRAVEVAFGWAFGSIDRVARGREVVMMDPDSIAEIRERGWAKRDDAAVWEGFQAASQFARDCQVRGAPERLASDFIGDAVALLNAVSIGLKYPDLNADAEVTELRGQYDDDLDALPDERDDPQPIEGLSADKAARRLDQKPPPE